MRAMIVGAGIGGLTSAIALRGAGIDATVVERAGEIKEVGAGILLAANAVADDPELDARQDHVYNRSRPVLHCRDQPPGPRLHGLGFFANQYPQSATSEPHRDFLPGLQGPGIPTLVIKGRCDYLSWSSAQEYLGALPDARLLYLNDAGHNAYQDEPERFMAGVHAFLLGRTLPEPPYDGRRKPEGYEGPP